MADDISKKITIDVEVNPDGQQQVNQYKTAFDSLKSSVSNLSAPLSALSNNLSSLDRDISRLSGSIDKLNSQNKTLASTSDSSKNKVSDLVSSFASWASISQLVATGLEGIEVAASGGLAVLTVFAPVIISWVANLFKGNTTLTALNKTLKDNKLVMDAVNQTMLQGRDDAQQQLTHLGLLYKASQDHNLSLNNRKKIVAELQSQYPAYFGNISQDAILAGKAAKNYDELSKAIIATARAKAAEDVIVKNQVRQLGNEDKLQKLKKDLGQYNDQLATAQKNYNSYMKNPSINGSSFGTGDNEESALYQRLAATKDKANEAQKAISHLNTDSKILAAQNNALTKTVMSNTEKYGAGVLQVAQTTGNQLIQINQATIKKQKALIKKAKKQQTAAPRGEEITDTKSPVFTPVDHPVAEQTLPIQAAKKTEDKIVAIKKTALQQVEDFAKQSAGKIANDALNALSTSIKQQSEAKVAALEKDKTAELTNSGLTSAQKLAIENKYKQQEAAIKAKAFKEEQEASIAQAVINGALAVTKVSAQSGILAPLEIGAVIAETAAQVAKIAAQKAPAYAKGGLHYQSDGRGGVLPGYSKTDNTNAYLRSGEGIVVSEAMQTPWARNLVSAINVGFGGRDFSMANPGRGYAIGGIFTDGGDANRYYNQPVTDQKNLANTIAYQMINNFPPVYVDVKDVNNQQNILAQTVNRVNL